MNQPRFGNEVAKFAPPVFRVLAMRATLNRGQMLRSAAA